MRGYSYADARAWKVDAHRIKEQFATVSKDELATAYQSNLSAAAYQVWLFLLHKVNGRTPAVQERSGKQYYVTLTEIKNLTGLSRASIFRAQKQLVTAGLIGQHKKGKRVYAWLRIPRESVSEMQPVDSGKPSEEKNLQSQYCDFSDPSQNRAHEGDPVPDSEVSILRQDPISLTINSSIPLTPDPGVPIGSKDGRVTGDAETVRPTVSNSGQRPARKKKQPTGLVMALIDYLHPSKADWETEEENQIRRLDLMAQWREQPEAMIENLRAPIPLRNGGHTTRLKLNGWHGTQRRRDIAIAAQEAIEILTSQSD
jgi:hypothetical protein